MNFKLILLLKVLFFIISMIYSIWLINGISQIFLHIFVRLIFFFWQQHYPRTRASVYIRTPACSCTRVKEYSCWHALLAMQMHKCMCTSTDATCNMHLACMHTEIRYVKGDTKRKTCLRFVYNYNNVSTRREEWIRTLTYVIHTIHTRRQRPHAQEHHCEQTPLRSVAGCEIRLAK